MDCERTTAASRSRLAANGRTKKRVVFFIRDSELQPCAELHAAKIAAGLGNLAKTVSPEINVGECEPLVIGHVEHFGANLQLSPFFDFEFLHQRCIEIANAVAAQIREMPGTIAGNVVARIFQTSVVQVRCPGPRGLMNADASPELRAGHVGTLIAIGYTSAVNHHNRDWLSRLQGDEAFQGPTANNGIHNTVHAGTDPSASTDRQVKD